MKTIRCYYCGNKADYKIHVEGQSKACDFFFLCEKHFAVEKLSDNKFLLIEKVWQKI